MTTNTQTECWCFESISECCCYEDCRMQVRRCCRCDQDIIRVVKVWMNKNNNKDKDTVEWEKGELLLQLPSSISAQRKFVFVVREFSLQFFHHIKLTGLSFVPVMHQDTRVFSSKIEIQLRSTETRNSKLLPFVWLLCRLLFPSRFFTIQWAQHTSK